MKLFSEEELIPWKAEWKDMPEYDVEDLSPKYQIVVSFACAADIEEFGKLIGQDLKASCAARQSGSIWFPEQEIGRYANFGNYPFDSSTAIYSKGRTDA